ncbi:MAG: 5'/3'-nucleotidase SurE [Microthrixaceae bacterium]
MLASVLVAGLLAAGAGCSSGDDGATTTVRDAASTPATTATARPLRVLVTNDDGVGAPGIDALVTALRAVPDTEVVVVAPLRNQSGTGGRTTPGGAPASPATTASGVSATAVDGFPADAVTWALGGGVPQRPDVVLSGVNAGQNLGQLTAISGTVGAAKAAGAAGIPALAVSQGLGEPPDFASGAKLAVNWLQENRAQLLKGAAPTPAAVESLNVPTCSAGTVRGVVDVPLDLTSQVTLSGPVDCAVTTPNPGNDVGAFAAGFAPLSPVTVG